MRLTAQKLGAERGGERIFDHVNFSVGEGEALVVTGENGSGKSTLLRVIAGLLPASEGAVQLEEAGEAYPTVPSALHYLGHQNGMKPALSVEENLRFWQDFQGEPHMDVEEALEFVGLEGSGPLPFATLSTGQRRRASIARLLVSWRPIWLLDEPTSGLDKASERQFAALMQAHRAEGGMIIAATHLPLGLADAQVLEMGGVSGMQRG